MASMRYTGQSRMPGRSTLNGQSFIPRLGQLLARQTGLRFHDVIQVCKITEPHWDAGEAIKMDAQRLAMLPRTVKNIQRVAAKALPNMHTA